MDELARIAKEFLETMNQMTRDGTLKLSQWADDTGHIVAWAEYDSIESFTKYWSVENWHMWLLELTPLVDNMSVRVQRPADLLLKS